MKHMFLPTGEAVMQLLRLHKCEAIQPVFCFFLAHSSFFMHRRTFTVGGGELQFPDFNNKRDIRHLRK